MDETSIVTTGIKENIIRYTELYSKLPQIMNELVQETGDIAFQKAKQICPVRTGLMRNSINLIVGSNYYSLLAGGNDAFYAVFNEYGSITTPVPGLGKTWGVRPFLRPSMNFSLRFIPKKYWDKISIIFGGATGYTVRNKTYGYPTF